MSGSSRATPDATLATVLVTLALSTALLGAALMLTGYFRLASCVQYLPLPVVGGYMAFIGLFCGEAGLSLMPGQHIQGLLSVTRVRRHDIAPVWVAFFSRYPRYR